MKRDFLLAGVLLIFAVILSGKAFTADKNFKIMVVSSYHREYLWSQDTNAGVCQALLDFKFLDTKKETAAFTKNDYVKGKKTEIKKLWMNTKRKSSRHEIIKTTDKIKNEINKFNPDLILLGDDNAANYIGNQFIDSKIPVVFWGINGLPVKYGLIDSMAQPGHNVTGTYQAGYLKECIFYLKKLYPGIKTFAVLSDDSKSSRAKSKELEFLAYNKELPIKLKQTIMTNSFADWKKQALKAAKEIDAFFVLNHNTLKDDNNKPVDQLVAGKWYLKNIKKPECSHEKQFAEEGMLLVVDDSGFKQGYTAVKIANEILQKGKSPAGIKIKAPERGKVIVNRQRVEMLKLDLSDKKFIESFINKAQALNKGN